MYLPISAPEYMYLCIEGTVSFVGGSLVDSSEAIWWSPFRNRDPRSLRVAPDSLRDLAETIKVMDELISYSCYSLITCASATRKLNSKLRRTRCGTELYETIRRVVQSESFYTFLQSARWSKTMTSRLAGISADAAITDTYMGKP